MNDRSTTQKILREFHLKNIILDEKLGSGNVAVVYKARLKNDNNDIVAVKIAKAKNTKTLNDSNPFEKEKNIAEYLQQYAEDYYPLVLTLGYTSCAIVMEFMKNGDLYDFLFQKKNTALVDQFTPQIMIDFMQAVYFLHYNGVLHRDIKLENIMLDENMHAKLGDFGFSIIINQDNQMKTLLGTEQYFSPELLLAFYKNELPPFSYASDMWAVGVVAFEILAKLGPYNSSPYSACENLKKIDEIEKTILKKTKLPSIPDHIPNNLRLLIQETWTPKPEDRYTAPKALDVVMTHYKK